MSVLSLDDLVLEGGSGRYQRDLGEGWTYADRIFGGYTAGLALCAAGRESPQPHAIGAQVVFLDAARPGVISLTVRELRAGRRAWAAQVSAVQADREILTCTTWFGERDPGAAATPAAGMADAPAPADCPSLSWLAQEWPFVSFLEERAIDYPLGPEESSGPSRADMWARASKPLGDDPFLAQVFDLMLADAHTLDASIRPTGLISTFGVSLDLTLSWERPAPLEGWLRLTATAGPADDGFVACTGTIRAQDGTLRATVLTNGRILGST